VNEHTPSTPREAEPIDPVVTAGAWEIIPRPNTDDIEPLDCLGTYDLELIDFCDEAKDALDKSVFAYAIENWPVAKEMLTKAIALLEGIRDIVSLDLLPTVRELHSIAERNTMPPEG
jgi:hypothetical protein